MSIRIDNALFHASFYEVTLTGEVPDLLVSKLRSHGIKHIAVATDIALLDYARSRWKIENESFNELKNNGYHLEHNFGHGQKGLTNVLLVLNFIAFAIHTVCDEMCRLWQKARKKLAARCDFFTDLAVLPKYLYFDDWASLLKKLVQGRPP